MGRVVIIEVEWDREGFFELVYSMEVDGDKELIVNDGI